MNLLEKNDVDAVAFFGKTMFNCLDIESNFKS